MAGEIQLNSTTFATESSGTITVSNVDSATNRTNLGLGSMATQNANAVAITGGTINTVPPATGQSLTIKDEDGNTAITVGTDNTAAGYLSLNFGSYHGDSGGAGSGTLTSNTLSDYEIGSWTPTVGGVSQTANGNWYTKIGRFVMVSADFTISSAPSTNYTDIAGLPFSAGVNYSGVVTFGYNEDGSATMTGLVDTSGNMSLYSGGSNRPSLNNGDRVIFAAYYQTA